MTRSNRMWESKFRRRKLLKGIGAVGVGAGLASAGLVACGDDDDAGSSEQPDSTVDPTPDGGPKAGGRLVIATNLPSTTLNPYGTVGITRQNMQQMFEPLRRLNTSRPPDEPLDIEPGLAESFEQPEQVRIIYHLREGVQFQDGTPFNSDAVVVHFDRIMNRDSPFYSEVGQQFMKASYDIIDSVKAVGSHSVALTLKAPYYDWHILSSVAANGIVSPAALQKYGEDGFSSHPAGTGAFRVKRFEAGADTILERSPGYWGGDAYLDEVVFAVRGDANSRLAAVLSGEADWAIQLSQDDVGAVDGHEDLRSVTKAVGLVQRAVVNCMEGPTANPMVRQAINHAISQEDISAAYGGLKIPAYSSASPGTPVYDPAYEPYKGRDVKKAKQLLAAAGHDDGFDVRMIYKLIGNGVSPPEAAVMQQQLAEVGINGQVLALENAAFEDINRANNGGVPSDVWATTSQFGWTSFYAVNRNFATTSTPPAGNNFGFYSNKEIDRLAEKLQLAIDADEHAATWAEVDELLAEEAPWVYLYHEQDVEIIATKVGGYSGSPTRFFDLRPFWIKA